MKLVVGLGNPGLRYANSRHNIGFRVVEALAHAQGLEIGLERFLGLYAEGVVPPAAGGTPDLRQDRLGFLEPTTFMNRSGESIAAALAELPEIEPSRDLLVIYDDLDLPLGRLRLRPRGGAGGHNGMVSVIDKLGPDFARLRFGIGRPTPVGAPAREETIEFVLDTFSPIEEKLLAERIPQAAEAAAVSLRDGVVLAMDRFNRTPEAPDVAETTN